MGRSVAGQVITSNAVATNGSSSYITRNSVSSVTNNFSMFCWAKITSLPASSATIFSNGDSGGNGYVLRVNSTGLFNGDYSFVVNIPSASTLSLATWYHLGMIRNAGTTQMYVNGSASGSTVANTPNTPGSFLSVGCQRDSGGTASAYFNGSTDDARIYERALSTGEVTSLYNYGVNVNNGDIINTNLVLWYKFDETSGNASDSSGNGYTGTNTNTATYTTGKVMTSNIPARSTSGTRTSSGTRTVAS